MKLREHAPPNAMVEPDEIARFHDRCSTLMRELLGVLADAPDRPRPFPQIEDALGWPRRRIASVLGGVFHLRQTEFGGRRPYRFLDERCSPSGRWELWMDHGQAKVVRALRASAPSLEPSRRRAESLPGLRGELDDELGRGHGSREAVRLPGP